MKTNAYFLTAAFLLISALCLRWPAAARASDPEADRILQMYQTQQTAAADAAADAYLTEHSASDQRCALLLAGASAERALFDARPRLRRTADQCATAPEGARALAELAQLLHLAGQDRAALATCDEFAEHYPDHDLAPHVMLLRGAAELSLPAGSVAGDAYQKFLAKWPDSPRAAEALAGLAESRMRQGNWQAAEAAYLRALAAAPDALDLPAAYLSLGLAAEKQGRKDAARRYYRELTHDWPDADAAVQARERLEGALAVGQALAATPPVEKEKYAASVGVFPSLRDAERAAEKFTAAGMRVRLVLHGRQCELMVGEFDSEPSAALFAQELTKRFQTPAAPALLP
jgi:tetratricopeptide (TPR) repeat protein